VIVGLAIAYLGTLVDPLVGASRFGSTPAKAAGVVLLALGFGPYRLSRNPLYLGGNVFIFFGGALLLGSVTALIATALHLPLIDLFIRREERQLERDFGEQWRGYKQRVRRWL
jgi:protein-S-isoprenylcysteine O-methyltransferase Ste14